MPPNAVAGDRSLRGSDLPARASQHEHGSAVFGYGVRRDSGLEQSALSAAVSRACAGTADDGDGGAGDGAYGPGPRAARATTTYRRRSASVACTHAL